MSTKWVQERCVWRDWGEGSQQRAWDVYRHQSSWDDRFDGQDSRQNSCEKHNAVCIQQPDFGPSSSCLDQHKEAPWNRSDSICASPESCQQRAWDGCRHQSTWEDRLYWKDSRLNSYEKHDAGCTQPQDFPLSSSCLDQHKEAPWNRSESIYTSPKPREPSKPPPMHLLNRSVDTLKDDDDIYRKDSRLDGVEEHSEERMIKTYRETFKKENHWVENQTPQAKLIGKPKRCDINAFPRGYEQQHFTYKSSQHTYSASYQTLNAKLIWKPKPSDIRTFSAGSEEQQFRDENSQQTYSAAYQALNRKLIWKPTPSDIGTFPVEDEEKQLTDEKLQQTHNTPKTVPSFSCNSNDHDAFPIAADGRTEHEDIVVDASSPVQKEQDRVGIFCGSCQHAWRRITDRFCTNCGASAGELGKIFIAIGAGKVVEPNAVLNFGLRPKRKRHRVVAIGQSLPEKKKDERGNKKGLIRIRVIMNFNRNGDKKVYALVHRIKLQI